MRALRPAVVLTLAVLGVAAVAATVGTPEPGAAGTSSDQVPVAEALLVCPAVVATAAGVTTSVTAAAPGSGGTLTLQRLGAKATATPLAVAEDGQGPLRWDAPAGSAGAVVVRAEGVVARGLVAQQVSRVPAGSGRALAAAPCAAAATSAWFVGAGASQGRRAVLRLANPTPAPAVADVTVWTSKGPEQPTAAQGITLASGTEKAVPLDALVPGEAVTVVRVTTRAGRVASSLSDSAVNGLRPAGADWVPQGLSPARDVLVPGVVTGASRQLTLLAPGADDALVKVTVLGAEGAVVPVGLDQLAVPAGQLVSVDLTKVSVAGAYAVRLQADHPLVAGVRVTQGSGAQLPDAAFAASAPPLSGVAMVPDTRTPPAQSSSLVLTAAAGDSSVLVTEQAPGAAPVVTRVPVPAGTTVVVGVGPARPGWGVARLQVEGGRLWVGWALSEAGARGPLLTLSPVLVAPAQVTVPRAAPDPVAGLG